MCCGQLQFKLCPGVSQQEIMLLLINFHRLICVGIFFVFANLLSLAQAADEPSYGGRTLTQWLEDGIEKNPFLSRDYLPAESKCAIKSIGTNAIPTLISMIEAHNSPFNQNRAFLEHNRAMLGFDTLGNMALGAAPTLAILTRDKDECVRYAALESLLHVSTNKKLLIPILVTACHDNNKRIQFLAGSALHFMSPETLKDDCILDPVVLLHYEALRNTAR